MEVLNDVLGSSSAAEPPMRDIDGALVAVRVRRVPNMHALTADGANQEEQGRPDDTALPLVSAIATLPMVLADGRIATTMP
jgi:hypothetical protein